MPGLKARVPIRLPPSDPNVTPDPELPAELKGLPKKTKEEQEYSNGVVVRILIMAFLSMSILVAVAALVLASVAYVDTLSNKTAIHRLVRIHEITQGLNLEQQ